MNDPYFTELESPVGVLTLTGTDKALTGLYFENHGKPHAPITGARDAAPFEDVLVQLQEYFDGKRTAFDVALAGRGTVFQRRVWDALREIPFGETWSYADLARAIGRPTASRAVGAANGRNPISIIVPCHRVVGSDGSLTGYAGGMERKTWLLHRERTSDAAPHRDASKSVRPVQLSL